VPLIWLRLVLAALFLSVVGVIWNQRLQVREHWRHFLVLGLVNSGLPFLFFGFAARTLSASLLSILNATAPIWAAVIGAIWTKSPLSRRTAAGLVLGVSGVAILVGLDPAVLSVGAYRAIGLALIGAFLYGVSSIYARTARKIEPFANAHGSMWAAALMLTPAVPFFVHAVPISPLIALAVIALGVLCSGVAYLLYFRLIADVGPASALTVTFLVPVFGVIWGHFFLNEPVGLATLAGAAIVVVGTALVTGFSVTAPFVRTPKVPTAPDRAP
jgi:drug/metabolite transporter (DMT)-like permease